MQISVLHSVLDDSEPKEEHKRKDLSEFQIYVRKMLPTNADTIMILVPSFSCG
jgi:hypothetical protein